MKNENMLFSYKNYFPKIHDSVFLASGVKIIGNVEIAENSSVWYNSVIRGDVNYIKIGDTTNIQDGSVLHVTSELYPLNIGNNVTVGHKVMLHGCKINDLSLIGMGAIVLDGAVVESNSIVAAGAVVKQKFVVPEGKLVTGVPAKIVRDLTDEEIEGLKTSAQSYKKYAEISFNSLVNNLPKS